MEDCGFDPSTTILCKFDFPWSNTAKFAINISNFSKIDGGKVKTKEKWGNVGGEGWWIRLMLPDVQIGWLGSFSSHF